jgi:hypothetical protein
MTTCILFLDICCELTFSQFNLKKKGGGGGGGKKQCLAMDKMMGLRAADVIAVSHG